MSHVDPFNALGGFSVGIPPELVIDETGNVVNNVNAPNANVTANRVYSNAYFWANGTPFTPEAVASGSNTQVQFNNNGNFGASANFTFNSSTNLLSVTKLSTTSANLGNIANLVITGGLNGYFLQTDGAGNLTWAAGTGNGGGGSPGGANTQVQFNDAGNFAGQSGFTFNKTTNTLSVSNTVTAGNLLGTDANISNTITVVNLTATNLSGNGANITNIALANTANTVIVGAQPNITSLGTLTSLNITGNITNANWINAVYFAGNGHNLFGLPAANITGTVANANYATFAGTVTTAAQPNITSVGNLTSLVVTGNTTLGNNVTANFFTGNLYGLANLAKNVTLGAQPNITTVGTLTTLAVSGNTNLGNTNATNLFANNFTVESSFTTLGNVVAGNVYANTGNIRANIIIGTLATGAQPNITSVGVLTTLAVSGNLSAGNANLGNLAVANFVTGTLTTNSQPNINFVGNLGWLNVQTGLLGSNGNITFNGSILGNGSYSNISITGNLDAGNYVQAERLIGSIATSSQPNITSVGNLTTTGLTVNGNSNLGSNANIYISGGNPTQVLSTDGLGNLYWSNGGGGGTEAVGYYLYTQNSANTTWTINHGLNTKYVSVTPIFANSTAVTGHYDYPNVVYNNANAVTLTFSSAITGYVAISGDSGNSDGYYLHNQSAASTTWTVNHNLNSQYVAVAPASTADLSWYGRYDGPSISYTNANSLTLTFSSAEAGNVAIIGSSNIAGYYTHTQSVANTTWVVNHNLAAKYLSVTPVYPNNVSMVGTYDFPNITYNNANALTLTFSSALTGNVVVVGGGGEALPAGGSNTEVQFNNGGALDGDSVFNYDTNTNILSVPFVTLSVVAFANLPAATTAGRKAFVSDGNLVASGNFGAVISGGGSNTVPVYSDGTNWRIG